MIRRQCFSREKKRSARAPLGLGSVPGQLFGLQRFGSEHGVDHHQHRPDGQAGQEVLDCHPHARLVRVSGHGLLPG